MSWERKDIIGVVKNKNEGGSSASSSPRRRTPYITRNLPSFGEKELRFGPQRMPGSSIRAALTRCCHLEAFSDKREHLLKKTQL